LVVSYGVVLAEISRHDSAVAAPYFDSMGYGDSFIPGFSPLSGHWASSTFLEP
jgi:hypothetical protein